MTLFDVNLTYKCEIVMYPTDDQSNGRAGMPYQISAISHAANSRLSSLTKCRCRCYSWGNFDAIYSRTEEHPASEKAQPQPFSAQLQSKPGSPIRTAPGADIQTSAASTAPQPELEKDLHHAMRTAPIAQNPDSAKATN